MEYLQKINSVTDLKKLSIEELKMYAEEVRAYIIDVVKNNGGHLASNLGTIEMTIAMHYVFNAPIDKIIWDVGHQSYTHKIITGRREKFKSLRQNGGISGFPKTSESEYDCFTMGHSSTSLSVALGMARARDLQNLHYQIISIIGDGAFTGGLAYEAINDIGASKSKMVIILNDNKMSISKNVGALSKYLAKLRLSKRYSRIKQNIKKGVSSLPFFGDKLVRFLDNTKDTLKSLLLSNKMFENLGIKYYGPFDGHDISALIDVFNQVGKENKPMLIHIVTNKGNGMYQAEQDPLKYHGISSANDKSNEISYSNILGDSLIKLADKNGKVIAITAAMGIGTGLEKFEAKFPERYFDVGIAEQHATTMSAGLAASGMKPYFAVYSSFLQRGFDQILHDVALNNLPVTFCIDRAGVVGSDGVTHQGVFDLSYLSLIPNMTIVTPKDGKELENILQWSLNFNAPLAIRYPKSFLYSYVEHSIIEYGKWEYVVKNKSNIFILAAGNRMLDIAKSIENVNIINSRFIKPPDYEMLDNINKKGNIIITLEDNVIRCGFGEEILSYLNQKKLLAQINILGYYDTFIDNYSVEDSIAKANITKENISKIIAKMK